MTSNAEEKCSCGTTNDSDSEPAPKENKKSKINLASLSLNLRRGRSLPLKSKRSKKSSNCTTEAGSSNNGSHSGNVNDVQNSCISTNSKKSTKWPLKFYCGRKEARTSPVREEKQSCCKCTCYKRIVEEQPSSSGDDVAKAMEDGAVITAAENINEVPVQVAEEVAVNDHNVPDVIINTIDSATYAEANVPDGDQLDNNSRNRLAHIFIEPNFADLQWRPMGQEDVDEEARIQRAREIERGVDPPPSFARRVQLFCTDENEGHVVRRVQIICPNDVTVDSLRAIFQNNVTFRTCPLDVITGCHTQVDFIHCLVPDLFDITNCSFYWGKMDRYEAERLLDGKREGTFLLRDSAQEEFLFSVSFRKYNRSLHARIEQWNHRFSFDSHDPGVYTSDTVCGLIEHYKDPSSCMFFEPMLTWPLHRNFVFSLQHLCRAVIVSRLTYDDVNQLQLPKTLKNYLKEYHYRQKVRVERFDDDVQCLEVRNAPS